MRNLTNSILFCILFNGVALAQITGAAVVCPAYLYHYSASVPGAITYNWTLPNGWRFISGQGSSNVNVFCNTNIDTLCVDALDGSGNLLSHSCQSLSWGGSVGWDAAIVPVLPCLCDPVAIAVTPNSSVCPGNCTGTPSPNTFFAAYDAPWPGGVYLGPANSATTFPRHSIGNSYTVYIYAIDTTWGLINAVQITGGSCPITTNNSVTIGGCSNLILSAVVSPDTVCVGDTFSLTGSTYGNSPLGFDWSSADTNITFLGGQPFTPIAQGVLTGLSNPPMQLTYRIIDNDGCIYFGHGYFIPSACSAIPSSRFIANDTIICPSACINFTNQTMFGTSYRWLFPGANPATDSSVNPHNICYSTPGNYDVTLISSNQNGSDTLNLHNFITVHQVNVSPIIKSGDTLYAGANYVSYQWYEDSVLVPAANDYFFVPQHNGNYGVTIVDNNGCEATTFLLGVMASVNEYDQNKNKFSVYYKDGNVFVNFMNNEATSANIEIVNPSGEIFYSEKSILNNSLNRINLPENLSTGVYVIRIRTKELISVNKFVVN